MEPVPVAVGDLGTAVAVVDDEEMQSRARIDTGKEMMYSLRPDLLDPAGFLQKYHRSFPDKTTGPPSRLPPQHPPASSSARACYAAPSPPPAPPLRLPRRDLACGG